MTRRRVLPLASVAALALALAASGLARAAAQGRSEDLAIVGGTVLPMDRDTLLADHTVLVREGRITWVGPSRDAVIPRGARTIDARGRYVLPGLADMHVHVAMRDELPVYLAYGVTTVRNMRGSPLHLQWRREVQSGRLAGPTLYTTGPTLSGRPRANPAFVEVTTPDEARAAVRGQRAAGYDFIKVHSRIEPAVFDAVGAEARAQRMALVGHLLPDVGLARALRAGQRSIEHVSFAASDAGDERALRATVAALRGRAWVGTTAATSYGSRTPARSLDELIARGPGACRLEREAERRVVRALHAGGVALLAGTDASLDPLRPGESLHCELRFLRAAGLGAYEVLATATRNAGAFVVDAGADSVPFGVVRAGTRADLLVVDEDPRADLATLERPRHVIARGRAWAAASLPRLDRR